MAERMQALVAPEVDGSALGDALPEARPRPTAAEEAEAVDGGCGRCANCGGCKPASVLFEVPDVEPLAPS